MLAIKPNVDPRNASNTRAEQLNLAPRSSFGVTLRLRSGTLDFRNLLISGYFGEFARTWHQSRTARRVRAVFSRTVSFGDTMRPAHGGMVRRAYERFAKWQGYGD